MDKNTTEHTVCYMESMSNKQGKQDKNAAREECDVMDVIRDMKNKHASYIE